MDERELTKLWYLADALVRAPSSWMGLFAAVERDSAQKPSSSLQKSLRVLREALERETKARATADQQAIRRIATDLLKSREEPVKDAGRALAWALENAPAARREFKLAAG